MAIFWFAVSWTVKREQEFHTIQKGQLFSRIGLSWFLIVRRFEPPGSCIFDDDESFAKFFVLRIIWLFLQPMWIYDAGEEKIVQRDVTYVPGLYKIFDEVLVNAADNKQRDKKMNLIRINISRWVLCLIPFQKDWFSLKNYLMHRLFSVLLDVVCAHVVKIYSIIFSVVNAGRF